MILGIDQSLSSTGWSVVDGDNLVETGEIKTKCKGIERLCFIRDQLKEVFNSYPEISIVSREDYAYASSGRATFSLGELGGVIDTLIYDISKEQGLSYYHMPIQTWKKIVLGSGSVSKDTAYLLIFKGRTGIDFTSDNIADSYGIAKATEVLEGILKDPQSIYTKSVNIQQSLYDEKRAVELVDDKKKKISFKRALKEERLHQFTPNFKVI